jgi:hypothetical protein
MLVVDFLERNARSSSESMSMNIALNTQKKIQVISLIICLVGESIGMGAGMVRQNHDTAMPNIWY